ncbi:hypothetical protein ACQJBY_059711 [Aegilops geniculata]
MGQEHTTRPSNREAAVRLSRHLCKGQLVHGYNRAPVRLSRLKTNLRKSQPFNQRWNKMQTNEAMYRQILWLGIKRRWISKQSSPGYQSRLHAADRTPLNGACC